MCRNGPKLTHLQYADDTLMFCTPDVNSLLNIKKSLILFQLVSGLKVNFHKTSMIGINVEDSWLQSAAKALLCKTGSLPLTYLGLPIGGSLNRTAIWDPVLARMEKKLASWKGNLLSIGGRTILIKASLSSLPLYYMSLFPIPKGVLEKIIKIQRKFMWCGSTEKRGMTLVSWRMLEFPKDLGGLGIGNLLHRNIALLFKWIWRFHNEPQALWRNVIQLKYGYGPTFSISDMIIPSHGGPWKSLCTALMRNTQARSIAQASIRKKLGNGLNVLFWHDLWASKSPLKAVCPRLYLISTSKDSTIDANGFWDGFTWKWSLVWARPLRPQDHVE